jgi:hypothetical protein
MDYQIFKSAPGLNIMEDLSKFLYENKQTYEPEQPLNSAFNEGARWAMSFIRGRINHPILDEGAK